MADRIRKPLALAVAGAAFATLTGAVPAAQATVPAAAPPAAGSLDWRACARPGGPPAQECAELQVPLDHADPDGSEVTLAVTRLRATGPGSHRGTLLALPGGPGGSGVQRVTDKGAALMSATGGAYDVVSFDPRGVGGSTKSSCGLSEEDRMLVNLRPWPGADGSITGPAGNTERSRRVAESCAREGGAVLRSLTSANQVRDIESLRRALGERRLSFWSTSYGAYVTAWYAQRYPQRTDRVVLDSSGDPDPERVERGWLANMAEGAEDRFPDFARWAADPAREAEQLRLSEHPDGVRPLFLRLAAQLDTEPRPSTTPGVPLTGNALRQSMQNALYDDRAFPQLATLLRTLSDPAGVPALPPGTAGPLSQADAAVSIAVICNDVRWPASVPAYQRAVDKDREAHPLTAGMPVGITPCAFWKHRPADKPVRLTSEGPSNILMVQNLRDPATPYRGALKMREAFGGRARMVAVDHGGHGVHLSGASECADRKVSDFLTTGRRPAGDVLCSD